MMGIFALKFEKKYIIFVMLVAHFLHVGATLCFHEVVGLQFQGGEGPGSSRLLEAKHLRLCYNITCNMLPQYLWQGIHPNRTFQEIL